MLNIISIDSPLRVSLNDIYVTGLGVAFLDHNVLG
jgi:hypothetical protein